ncbi:MAG: hypothetical protein CM15mP77_3670 [Synechococcus sp.]|nr:MAG: hypothetical protein CM15mP77_3670 [Synechococcus sp.]
MANLGGPPASDHSASPHDQPQPPYQGTQKPGTMTTGTMTTPTMTTPPGHSHDHAMGRARIIWPSKVHLLPLGWSFPPANFPKTS